MYLDLNFKHTDFLYIILMGECGHILNFFACLCKIIIVYSTVYCLLGIFDKIHAGF